MSSDLLYSLGLDITDFKTSAKASKESADDIKQGFKGLKDVLAAGGVATAVLGFFSQVVDYAQQASGKLDENTAAVKRFGDAIDANKKEVLGWGAQLLGFLNRAGEGWGLLIRGFIDGFDEVKKSNQEERESTAAAIAAREALNAAAARRNAIAAERKKLEQEFNALADQGLTKQETYNNLVQNARAEREKLGTLQKGSLDYQEQENRFKAASNAMLKARKDLDKEQSDEEKKRTAELAKQQKLLDEQKSKKGETVAVAKVQLATEEEITAELMRQRREQEAIVRLTYTASDGTDTQTLTDRQLTELLTETQKQLSAARVQNASNPFQFTNQGILNNRVGQLQDEMAERRRFRSDYASQGEGAFTNRSAFEEDRFRRYITPEDEQRQKDQANDISNISENLRRLINSGRG